MFNVAHIHPMLVHFPIVLIAFGFLAEFVYLFYKKETCLPKVGFFFLTVGTLAALVTVLSGFLFTQSMEGVAGQVRETHERFAIITFLFAFIAWCLRVYLLRQKKEMPTLNMLALVFYGLATLAVFVTGFFGGNLVYNYMMPL